MPLLAISQRCIQVGLPKVYSTLVFNDQSSSNKTFPTCNITLYAKPGYETFVFTLILLRPSGSPTDSDNHQNLFDFMTRSVFKNSLNVGDILSGISLLDSLKDEDRMGLIPKVGERFAERFSNINSIYLLFGNPYSGEPHLASQLVSACEKQLKVFSFNSCVMDSREVLNQLSSHTCLGDQ